MEEQPTKTWAIDSFYRLHVWNMVVDLDADGWPLNDPDEEMVDEDQINRFFEDLGFTKDEDMRVYCLCGEWGNF